jgi:hypothetical protein
LELIDEKGLEAGDLPAEIYELGGGWRKSDDREVISECAEKVTPLVDRLLALAREYPALSKDAAFRDLERNLADTEEEIELQSGRYNHFIDLYNAHRERPAIRPQIMILGAIPLRGIQIRPGNRYSPRAGRKKKRQGERMMKKRTILLFLLCAVLVSGLFGLTGCGKSPNTEKQTVRMSLLSRITA